MLVHEQRDGAHPDAAITRELADLLTDESDADGKPLEVTFLPAPSALRDAGGWVDYSYVNHYVANGAVIACAFDDPADAEARCDPRRRLSGAHRRPDRCAAAVRARRRHPLHHPTATRTIGRRKAMKLISAGIQPSLARVGEGDARQITVGLVQMHWAADPEEHLRR